MAHKQFILQGLTTRTHVSALRELFDVPKIQHVVFGVAFVTDSGVNLLGTQLKGCASQVAVFAGVRNDITSRQGLGRLLEFGVDLYVVDTGSRTVLFHPKLYLVRGQSRARLVIGSANLTIPGLNNNIEAGMLLDLDLDNADDKAVVDAIEDQFRVLPKDHPENVVKVASAAMLDDMQASGRLVDEMAVPPPRPSTAAGTGSSDTVPRIALQVPPLRRPLAAAKAPAALKAAEPSTPAKGQARPVSAPVVVGIELELVWESKSLTRRDLTIPTAANTHRTGSINLDKGLLEESVDHRHYFRDEVFAVFTWAATNATGKVEEAFAKFQLVLKGVSYGEFDLRIGHSIDTTSKMYQQRNAMTRLSWGPMREYVAHEDLIGRTLALYRDKADPKRFTLEID